jgi:hypothetical protein
MSFVYWNLALMRFEKPPESTLSSIFVRELLIESPRCDQYNKCSLKGVRDAYTGYIAKHGDKESLSRICDLKANEQDEMLAMAAVSNGCS